MSGEAILLRLFQMYSTWVLRENDSPSTHSSMSVSESLSMWKEGNSEGVWSYGHDENTWSHGHGGITWSHKHSDNSYNHTTPSTLQNSSLDINTPKEEDLISHTTYSSSKVDYRRICMIGRVDYEECLCDILPKFSKSRCVTQACRLFDQVDILHSSNIAFKGALCQQVTEWSLLFVARALLWRVQCIHSETSSICCKGYI